MADEKEYAPSPEQWVRDQVELYESSGGKEGNTLRGLPIVLLTTIGAKTGKVRKVPLMRVEHEGSYAAVASKGGAPEHPVWFYNLKANPDLEVRDSEQVFQMTAREISGDEYQQWWDRSVAAYPHYADYQTKTDRTIPLFVLEPRS